MTYEEAILRIKDHNEVHQRKERFAVKITEALNLAITALEKQIPKKPINVEKHYYECPCCEHDLGVSDDDIFVYENYRPMYCSNCGQALDWSDNGIF